MTITCLVRPPLSTLADHPSLSDSIQFQLSGLVVVFLALGSIWGLMELTGLCFRRRAAAIAPRLVEKPAEPPRVIARERSDTCAPDEAVLAVIAASVAAVVGGRHRIHAIAVGGHGTDWAREGRREIFASHRTR